MCAITVVTRLPRRATRGGIVPSDDIKDAINERTTEKDHEKVREMTVSYVKDTGSKVLACAEMTYQLRMAKEILVGPMLPENKSNVVWQD